MSAYLAGKLVHLAALVLWIGPPLGAYWLLYAAYASKDGARILWTERAVEQVLVVEHLAFVVLLGSGAFLVWASGGALLVMPWMLKKLALVAGVVAFELADGYLAHHVLHRLLRLEDPLGTREWARAERLRRRLGYAAALVGLILIPGIFYFAVSKQ